jgi:benzodiazapine receptor
MISSSSTLFLLFLVINPISSFITPCPTSLASLSSSSSTSSTTSTHAKTNVSPKLPLLNLNLNEKKGSTSTTLHAINPQSASASISASAIVWVASTVLGGTIGTPFVLRATKTWYNTIPLPTFTPPNFIFGPTWSLLYTSMGIASWRIRSILKNGVVSASTNASTNASVNASASVASVGSNLLVSKLQQYVMILSFVHYIMNISWAPIFFGMKRFRLGHVLNISIWATLIPIMIGYSTIDLCSGLLLLPYFLWLSFAIKLSNGICNLNPTDASEMNGRLFNNAKLENEIWILRKEAGKRVGL